MPELSHKTRRRLSLLVLIVGLPVYIVVASTIVTLFERPPILVELAIYVALGVLWAFPLRFVFKGVGREAPPEE
ncbi:hypothetical protein ATO8_14987 [Roseivivax marinus]|jgi:hypothetical protein|uniref:DUF2842 domain-containing protein n=1 Tax=Roseivivax marinus TaxID=1379903 RepID=W4HGV5_9RHOB|nr:DUF2842 domain-containing protein [Roseivivax marinus]ETW11982.1 hypothetical protein ATO8_14987 [Roseivivax marinus]UMA64069.1 DUF2842 domain-containing protein [Roseivivax marinus]SEK34850.1 Protein of unknown function [Roseivivax marinus]